MSLADTRTVDEVRTTFEAMDEAELLVQQIGIEGAITALAFLIRHGGHPLLLMELASSLRAQQFMAQEIAQAKGFAPVELRADVQGMH
jgi:hypothetical protein